MLDLIVIGAGAAGLMAGSAAAERGKSVLILEHSSTPARKVRAAGGGNCNFSNLNISPEHYLSENPRYCKSALAQYGVNDFLTLMRGHGLKWEERDSGKLFAFGATYVADMLVHGCVKAGAEINTGIRVIKAAKEGNNFAVFTDSGMFESRNLLVAVGGPSFPQLGGTFTGFDIAKGFGLEIVPPRPALAGILYPETLSSFKELSGISLKVFISTGKRSFTGDLLFTHTGLSGPAGFWLSLWMRNGQKAAVNFAPGEDIIKLLNAERKAGRTFASALSFLLPKKLACILMRDMTHLLANATREEVRTAAERVSALSFVPEKTEGYSKAEVTAGGVSTAELNSSTMESKKVKGLYFAGEVIDVTGELGGYNLHWAWASGILAGKKID